MERIVAYIHSAALLCPRVRDLFAALLTLGGQCGAGTEFGIRDNVPNTGLFLGHFFFGIRDIVLDI